MAIKQYEDFLNYKGTAIGERNNNILNVACSAYAKRI